MLKKTITYTDFNNQERKEDFYFNLSDAELMEMELSEKGGYAEMIERLIAEQDQPKIVKIFKELILKSYGKKSPDGRYFDKDERYTREFVGTNAYSKLFMELATNTESAIAFVNGVMPANLVEQAKQQGKLPMAN